MASLHTHALKRLIDAAKRIQSDVRLNSDAALMPARSAPLSVSVGAVTLVTGSFRDAAAAVVEQVGCEGTNRGKLLHIAVQNDVSTSDKFRFSKRIKNIFTCCKSLLLAPYGGQAKMLRHDRTTASRRCGNRFTASSLVGSPPSVLMPTWSGFVFRACNEISLRPRLDRWIRTQLKVGFQPAKFSLLERPLR